MKMKFFDDLRFVKYKISYILNFIDKINIKSRHNIAHIFRNFIYKRFFSINWLFHKKYYLR